MFDLNCTPPLLDLNCTPPVSCTPPTGGYALDQDAGRTHWLSLPLYILNLSTVKVSTYCKWFSKHTFSIFQFYVRGAWPTIYHEENKAGSGFDIVRLPCVVSPLPYRIISIFIWSVQLCTELLSTPLIVGTNSGFSVSHIYVHGNAQFAVIWGR
jgi:hypothetical protein